MTKRGPVLVIVGVMILTLTMLSGCGGGAGGGNGPVGQRWNVRLDNDTGWDIQLFRVVEGTGTPIKIGDEIKSRSTSEFPNLQDQTQLAVLYYNTAAGTWGTWEGQGTARSIPLNGNWVMRATERDGNFMTILMFMLTSHPLSQTKGTGESVTFQTEAVGGRPPYTYQWRKGGANIPGATGQSYTINSLTAAHAGQYTVVVRDSTNPQNSVTSDPAQLTVVQQVTITQHPQSHTRNVGESVTFNVTAAGGATPYTYQWRKDGANIPGATGQSYQINSLTAAHAGQYSVVVRDSSSPQQSVTSNNAQLTVQTPQEGPAMVRVNRGSFMMGNTRNDSEGRDWEKPVHRVTLTYDYWIGKYEVTFAQYDAFCNATGRSKPSDHGWGRGTRPVINVSWNDAIAYCNWLSDQNGLARAYDNNGNLLNRNGQTTTDITQVEGYRLPTESEWEYAARGGHADITGGVEANDFKYAGSNNIDAVAWYWDNWGEANQKTQPVGGKAANELGLHDMSGNVWEWCHDWYGSYTSANKTNPIGSSTGSYRVERGGSWLSDAQYCRVARRNYLSPGNTFNSLGFRITRTHF